jgi:hypothetical protein
VVTTLGLPVRLPTGWVALEPEDATLVAALPSADGQRPAVVLTITPTRDPPAIGDTVDQLRAALPGRLLLVDDGPERCRRDTPAHRVVTAHFQNGRGVTTELWLVAGDHPAVLCAAVDTARYAELGPVVRRTLRSYRPNPET